MSLTAEERACLMKKKAIKNAAKTTSATAKLPPITLPSTALDDPDDSAVNNDDRENNEGKAVNDDGMKVVAAVAIEAKDTDGAAVLDPSTNARFVACCVATSRLTTRTSTCIQSSGAHGKLWIL